MHPMFVTLFVETDADDLLADEEERRHGRRARASRPPWSPGPRPATAGAGRNLMAPVFARERTAWARVG
jgi:hypothetical protein